MEGEGTEQARREFTEEGKQYYSEGPTQPTKSAVAHLQSHGNCSDNLTPVDQTGLQIDCTQSS